MKRFFAKTMVVALAAGSLAAPAAASTCMDLGTLNSSAIFGTDTVSSGSFSECYSFSVAAPFAFSATAVNIPVSNPINGSSLFDIDGLVMSVVNTGVSVMTMATGTSYSASLQGLNYQATVSGNATGSAGGAYAFAFSPAVPEPGEWALMLSGLGLIGVMVRRRTAGGSPAA